MDAIQEILKRIQGTLFVGHSEVRSLVALLSPLDQDLWAADHEKYMEDQGLDPVTGMPQIPPDDQDSDG